MPTYYGVNIIKIVTDDGPPYTCHSYNDWGLGWFEQLTYETTSGHLPPTVKRTLCSAKVGYSTSAAYNGC